MLLTALEREEFQEAARRMFSDGKNVNTGQAARDWMISQGGR